MLRAALASLLALASVWTGPVAQFTDIQYDISYGFLNRTNATVFRRDEFSLTWWLPTGNSIRKSEFTNGPRVDGPGRSG